MQVNTSWPGAFANRMTNPSPPLLFGAAADMFISTSVSFKIKNPMKFCQDIQKCIRARFLERQRHAACDEHNEVSELLPKHNNITEIYRIPSRIEWLKIHFQARIEMRIWRKRKTNRKYARQKQFTHLSRTWFAQWRTLPNSLQANRNNPPTAGVCARGWA